MKTGKRRRSLRRGLQAGALALTLLGLPALHPADAAPTSFSGTLFDKPEGWQEQGQGAVRTLVAPPAAPGEALLVVVSAAKPASGDAAAQLQAFAAALETQGRRISAGPVQSGQRGALQTLNFSARVDQAGIGEHDRIYQVVSDGRNSVFAAVLLRGDATFAAQRGALAQLLASLAPAAAGGGAVPPAVAQAGLSAGIPYGGKPVNQLDKAFRPSGRGKPFPLPAIVDGRPVGPWWFLRVPGGGSNLFSGGVSLSTYVFFPDGTAAALFRPGGPQLADLESMHALGEDDYIGRFSVAGGVMNIAFGPDDRNLLSKPITVKQSGGTPYFLWWQREYQPALPVPRDFLLGTWRSGAMGTMSFRADGTVATTKNMVDTDWGSTVPVTGTWALDGYLFAMHFPGYGDRVYSLFRTASGSIVLNQSMMSRE